jgi:hypothetical protein
MKFIHVVLSTFSLALAFGGGTEAAAPPVAAPSSVVELEQVIKPLAGTLFFAPEQRVKMDRARKNPIPMIEDLAEEPVSSIVNGFVKRSDGQSVVWVDGEPRYNIQSANLTRLQPIDVGGEGKPVLLNFSTESTKLTAPAKLRAKKLQTKKFMRPRAAKKQLK